MTRRNQPTDEQTSVPPASAAEDTAAEPHPAPAPREIAVYGVLWIGPADRSRHVIGVPAMDHETDAETAHALVTSYPALYALATSPFPPPLVPEHERPPAPAE